MPDVPPPEALRPQSELVQEWLAAVPHVPDRIREAFLRRMAVEFRPIAPRNPLLPVMLPPQQAFWVRAQGPLPSDPLLHDCVLAYASDFSLLSTALLPHGRSWLSQDLAVASIDHALWFHRPLRIDDWLLYAMDSPTAQGGRGLLRGPLLRPPGPSGGQRGPGEPHAVRHAAGLVFPTLPCPSVRRNVRPTAGAVHSPQSAVPRGLLGRDRSSSSHHRPRAELGTARRAGPRARPGDLPDLRAGPGGGHRPRRGLRRRGAGRGAGPALPAAAHQPPEPRHHRPSRAADAGHHAPGGEGGPGAAGGRRGGQRRHADPGLEARPQGRRPGSAHGDRPLPRRGLHPRLDRTGDGGTAGLPLGLRPGGGGRTVRAGSGARGGASAPPPVKMPRPGALRAAMASPRGNRGDHRHRWARRPRQDLAGEGPHRHRHRPPPGGEAARHHPRAGLRPPHARPTARRPGWWTCPATSAS